MTACLASASQHLSWSRRVASHLNGLCPACGHTAKTLKISLSAPKHQSRFPISRTQLLSAISEFPFLLRESIRKHRYRQLGFASILSLGLFHSGTTQSFPNHPSQHLEKVLLVHLLPDTSLFTLENLSRKLILWRVSLIAHTSSYPIKKDAHNTWRWCNNEQPTGSHICIFIKCPNKAIRRTGLSQASHMRELRAPPEHNHFVINSASSATRTDNAY